jgi:diacylglycerol kinase (ATP)
MVPLTSSGAKRAAIIYNPVARGLARHRRLLQRSTGVLSSHGIETTLVATTAPGSASAQTRREIDAGCDLIIAAGGDGTINEIANGMLHSNVPLAILPGGTANVLAREMRIPLDFERAAAQIADLQPCRISIGRLRLDRSEPRCFLCMAGAGVDAEIVSRIHPGFKMRAGKFAYYAHGFVQVFRPLREFDVLIDGQSFRASFALISRVRNYGGDLEIALGASLLRDDFQVVLFRGTESLRYLRYLAGVVFKQLDGMPGCTVLRAQSVLCQAPPGRPGPYVQIDGELAGVLPATAEILPDALTLLMPAACLKRERALAEVTACA